MLVIDKFPICLIWSVPEIPNSLKNKETICSWVLIVTNYKLNKAEKLPRTTRSSCKVKGLLHLQKFLFSSIQSNQQSHLYNRHHFINNPNFDRTMWRRFDWLSPFISQVELKVKFRESILWLCINILFLLYAEQCRGTEIFKATF